MVRSVHASGLPSWPLGVTLRPLDGSEGLDLIFIFGAAAGFSAAFIPSCENGFDAAVGCAAGVGCFCTGGGVELLEMGAVGGVEVGFEGVLAGDGPPSFASRFARIYVVSASLY